MFQVIDELAMRPFRMTRWSTEFTVALYHLKRALKSVNPLILEQPLKITIEDNLFLLFFLSGWTQNKWIRTFQWQKATVLMTHIGRGSMTNEFLV